MRLLRNMMAAVALAALMLWLYPTAPRADERDAIDVTIWFNGPIRPRQIDALDAFERIHPHIRVTLGSSAVRTGLDGEGNPQRLMCGIAGGVPPEVVEYDRFAVCQWASKGAFLDLSPLIASDADALARAEAELHRMEHRAANDTPAIQRQRGHIEALRDQNVDPDDYFAATWDECRYQGGQFGVPNYMDTRVLYYNDDMLVRAGFANEDGRPRPPDTWEQVCAKRLDVSDAVIQGDRVESAGADFVAAGVREGDTLAHLTARGDVTRCLVAEVVGPHALRVKSAYARKSLSLPDGGGRHIKVFDRESYALRLSRWDDAGRLQVVGFEPQHGNAWLYLFGWANGGRFMSEDGRTCTLNDPKIVEALQWTTDLYDALGGMSSVVAFRKGFQGDAQDPFIQNQIAMYVNGDWFLRDLVRYKPDMRFGTYPPPVPAARAASGHREMTWVAGFAYCIPSTCAPEKRDAAWTLVKFLSSVRGGMLMNEHDAQRERAQGRLYMPRLKANRKLNDAQMDRYVRIPGVPQHVQAALQTHLDLLPGGYFRPVSPVGQKLWNAQADAQDLAWAHSMPVQDVLDAQTELVQRALDDLYTERPRGGVVNWWPWVAGYLVALVLLAVWVYRRYAKRFPARGFYRKEWLAGPLFASPWLIGFIALAGGPMVFSAVMSFTEYDVINDARWVGLDNYREMFTHDWGGLNADGNETLPTGVRHALVNTLYMAIGLPLNMIVGLALAMLLDTGIRGMRGYRTLFFLPAIMPVVAASILWLWVFNAQNGLMNWFFGWTGINALIDWCRQTFDFFTLRTPIAWLTDPHTSKPALIIMGLWGAGSSMIIWLAGLKSIPTHLYEAAAIDGAGPLHRLFRITLPMLSPYILFNLIIGLIQTFQIFTQAYIMTPNGYPERSTYFYVYKLFDECFSYFRLGYGSAMAWVLFAIVLALTLINMQLSRKWVYYAGE
jgi:multiple sugar transport system permease protein